MIIIGSCLVTAAIVYGFVDYLKTDKKQLERMYTDEPETAIASPVKPALPGKTVGTPAENVSAALTGQPVEADSREGMKKTSRNEMPKKLDIDLYSRAIPAEKLITLDSAIRAATPVHTSAAPPSTMVVPVIHPVAAPVVEPAKKPFVRSIRKPVYEFEFTKVDASAFSRAPLRKKKFVAVDTVVAGITAQ